MKARVAAAAKLVMVCLGLSVGASTAENVSVFARKRSDGDVKPSISEPASLMLLAAGLGIAARRLGRRQAPKRDDQKVSATAD